MEDDGTPCMNDGKCIDGLGMYSCSCTASFTGENCTIPGICTCIQYIIMYQETMCIITCFIDIVDSPQKPNITEPPKDEEASLLETVYLTCEALGSPNPIYSWYKVIDYM